MGRAGRTSSFDKPRRAQRATIALLCHPETPSTSVNSINVDIARTANGRIDLHYRLVGGGTSIVWPSFAEPIRADRLWETTCFELFVKSDGRISYFEFNFSPSREWAAYRFSNTREGMQFVQRLPAPQICPSAMEITVALDLGALPGLSPGQDWPIGLSAVVDGGGKQRSYWALKHAPGKPDFHHPDCFAFLLAPPGRA